MLVGQRLEWFRVIFFLCIDIISNLGRHSESPIEADDFSIQVWVLYYASHELQSGVTTNELGVTKIEQ